MAETHEFEPGTIVRFKNHSRTFQDMNNSYGIVKYKQDNGKLRIKFNSKNEFAAPVRFCDPVIQCLNEEFCNIPLLIWPRSKGETIPRAHWLHEAPKNPKKTMDYLENTLNWKRPFANCLSCIQDEKSFIVFHDSASTAKPNDVFNTILNSVNDQPDNDGKIKNIRGPVMFFNFCTNLFPSHPIPVSINEKMANIVARSEHIKNKLNGGTITSSRIYYYDLKNKQTSDSVCRKVQSKQHCGFCAKFVEKYRTNN